MVTIIVNANGVTAPKDFLDWLDATEGGVNNYLMHSSILKLAPNGVTYRTIEVALHTKYAEYLGYLQTQKELGIK